MSRGRKTELKIELDGRTRQELEAWQRSTSIPAGLARRGRIILLLASGTPVSDISRLVGIQRHHVYKWVRRYERHSVEGLRDLPRGVPTT